MCISQDLDRGIHWISINTGASRALLIALLIAEAKDEAAKKGTREILRYWPSLSRGPSIWSIARRLWRDWKRHWFDALAASLILFVVIGVVLRVTQIDKGAVQYVAAKPGISLPPFHQVSDEDVEMKSAPGAKGSFIRLDQVRGRYTLVAVPANGLLHANQLLSPQLSKGMQNHTTITVPLKPTTARPTLTAPAEAVLILSPRDHNLKSAEPVIFGVIVLHIDTAGESKLATIALPHDKLATVAPLLASHDVFLSEPIR
ncbi:MAG TPA: hypothetical protein VIT19_08625 [Pyrinomonadaceae bacterium]